MSTPSEQWVVAEVRRATERLELPPESRWIRERTSPSGALTPAIVTVAAVFLIAVIGVMLGLRQAPRLVPAAPPDTFAVAEDGAWGSVRSALSTAVVLRPTWLPAKFRATSADCPSPVVSIDTTGRSLQRYIMRYNAGPPDPNCAAITVTQYDFTASDGYRGIDDAHRSCDRAGTANARGSLVLVFICVDHGPQHYRSWTFLFWNEAGVGNEVGSNDLELGDLLRIVQSLEPVQ